MLASLRQFIPAQHPLSGALQARLLARHHTLRSPRECYLYHWFDLPDGTTLEGEWDLRRSWREYLGNVSFTGKRVLETGPACGFLSLRMEQDGAEVVSLDVRPGVPQDLIDCPTISPDEFGRKSSDTMESFRATWWYFHQLFKSKNKALYADIYDIPADIGRFDIGVVASILLHLARPYEALRQVAKLTDVIVLTDVLDPVAEATGTIRFMPTDEHWTWWGLSPRACERMLQTLGFTHFVHSRHEHPFHPRDDRPDKSVVMVPMFTVVASRARP